VRDCRARPRAAHRGTYRAQLPATALGHRHRHAPLRRCGRGDQGQDRRHPARPCPGYAWRRSTRSRSAGGTNHRVGLYDGILIKENHIIAAGGIREVVEQARTIAPSNVFIEVEVETLEQMREALDAGVKMILLDNMTLEQMREAVAINAGRAELEASGGVNLDRVRAIAETGVDRISIGTLTKDVRALDLSLRHVER
jgi:nicotinate-nucleotide pyrophosphorylase (carboxylating)